MFLILRREGEFEFAETMKKSLELIFNCFWIEMTPTNTAHYTVACQRLIHGDKHGPLLLKTKS